MVESRPGPGILHSTAGRTRQRRGAGVAEMKAISLCVSLSSLLVHAAGTNLSRPNWGAPPISVLHDRGAWTIAGRKHTAILDEKTFALTVRSGSNSWAMPSG